MLKKKKKKGREGLVCSTGKQETRRTVRSQGEWNEGRGGGQAGWNGMRSSESGLGRMQGMSEKEVEENRRGYDKG